jgi:hypothetical protein
VKCVSGVSGVNLILTIRGSTCLATPDPKGQLRS